MSEVISYLKFIDDITIQYSWDKEFKIKIWMEIEHSYMELKTVIKTVRIMFMPDEWHMIGYGDTLVFSHEVEAKLQEIIPSLIPGAKRIKNEPFITFDLKETKYKPQMEIKRPSHPVMIIMVTFQEEFYQLVREIQKKIQEIFQPKTQGN